MLFSLSFLPTDLLSFLLSFFRCVLCIRYSRTGKQKGGGAVSPPLGAENETFSQITTEM